MTLLLWAVSIGFTGYAAYRIGRRVEVGKREIELQEMEDRNYVKGQRPGTIRLSSIKIRR